MFPRFNKFEIPPDVKSGGSATLSNEMGKEDIIEFLAEDDKPEEEVIDLNKDKKKEEKSEEKEDEDKDEKEEKDEDKKEEDDEDEDELKAIEEELEEPDEEKLELTTPVRKRDILKKYPNLFKEFPYLEKAYYREQQFTEVFPTISDAKEAQDKAEVLDKLEEDLMGGNTEKILTAIKKENPKSFNRIVDNYLDTIGKIDPGAQQHIIGNIIKSTIIALAREGNKKGKEKFLELAEGLQEFVFGTSEFKPPSKLFVAEEENKDTQREKELEQRERQFKRERFETTRDELNERIENRLLKTIDVNIDPKNSMSDYIKKNASRDAYDTLTDLMDKDTRFKSILDRLWEASIKENFSKSSTERINRAYISKAQSLLPSVIKKARNEALRGIGKRVRDDSNEHDEKEESTGTGEKRKSTPPEKSGRKITKPGEIPSGMKTLDYLMQD